MKLVKRTIPALLATAAMTAGMHSAALGQHVDTATSSLKTGIQWTESPEGDDVDIRKSQSLNIIAQRHYSADDRDTSYLGNYISVLQLIERINYPRVIDPKIPQNSVTSIIDAIYEDGFSSGTTPGDTDGAITALAARAFVKQPKAFAAHSTSDEHVSVEEVSAIKSLVAFIDPNEGLSPEPYYARVTRAVGNVISLILDSESEVAVEELAVGVDINIMNGAYGLAARVEEAIGLNVSLLFDADGNAADPGHGDFRGFKKYTGIKVGQPIYGPDPDYYPETVSESYGIHVEGNENAPVNYVGIRSDAPVVINSTLDVAERVHVGTQYDWVSDDFAIVEWGRDFGGSPPYLPLGIYWKSIDTHGSGAVLFSTNGGTHADLGVEAGSFLASQIIATSNLSGPNLSVQNRATLKGAAFGLRTVSASTTVAPFTDFTIVYTNSSSVTQTIPTSGVTTGQVFVFKRAGTGALTLDPVSSVTIDGAATYSLARQHDSVSIQYDGSNYRVISAYRTGVSTTIEVPDHNDIGNQWHHLTFSNGVLTAISSLP